MNLPQSVPSPVVESITRTRCWWADLVQQFHRVLQGDLLKPEQVADMLDSLGNVHRRVVRYGLIGCVLHWVSSHEMYGCDSVGTVGNPPEWPASTRMERGLA